MAVAIMAAVVPTAVVVTLVGVIVVAAVLEGTIEHHSRMGVPVMDGDWDLPLPVAEWVC